MASIKLNLLDNNSVQQTYLDYYIDNFQNYHIVAGEQNATSFQVSRPDGYDNWTFTVEMVNAEGYGIAEKPIVDDEFVLPPGMAVAGYGFITIRAADPTNSIEKVWLPIKVKVWNTLPDWHDYVSDDKYVTLTQFYELADRVTVLEKKISTYVHTQLASSSVWVVKHNLHCRPSVTVVDSGENVVYGDIVYDNDNQLTITFTAPFGGKAYIN